MNQNDYARFDLAGQTILTTELLSLFLRIHSKNEFMQECLQKLRQWGSFSGVGIRVLDTLGNIPYQAYDGFSTEFINSEQWLSTLEDQCVCIRVARNVTVAQDEPFMTTSGSFFCNNTRAFLDSLKDSQKTLYRGVCITCGYASLAVIPIKYGSQILGVLHLVDTRQNVFSEETIKFMENSVASFLGEGIYRFSIEEKLQMNLETQVILTTLLKKSLEDLSLDSLLHLALKLIHSHKPLSKESKSAVFLSDADSQNLKPAAWIDFNEVDLVNCARVKPHVCACGQAAGNKKLVFSVETDHSQGGCPHYSVPILYQDTLLGVICIRLEIGHHRDERNDQFLSAVADTLAGIIWRKHSEMVLRKLSLRMLSVQEEERRYIALELHDQIGQMLTGLKLMLGQAFHSDEIKRITVLQEVQTMVTDLIVKTREMSLNLRPSMLDDLGLLPTLIWHFQRCKSQSGLNVDFRHSGLEVSFPKDVAIAAYRIVQEALTNVMRYAGVNQVLVEIWTEQDWLKIRIEDRGKGFRTEDISAGTSIGLQSMRERASLLGGSLSIDALPGRGTTILALLPLTIGVENVTISVDRGSPIFKVDGAR